MKKQERYKLINHAKKDYSERFKRNYEFKNLSRKALHKLLQQNKHSSMCEWDYCCYGLYQNCWQEVVQAGCWQETQKEVDDIINHTINSTAKICRKDSRILYCEDEYGIHVVIIARDICSRDFLITFTNEVI